MSQQLQRHSGAHRQARPYYRRKSEWAMAKANEVREQIARIRDDYVPSSDWRRVRQKSQLLSSLATTEAQWRIRASRYQQAGD